MTAMAEEIVPTPDQDSIFKQLEDYNWDKDKEYQVGFDQPRLVLTCKRLVQHVISCVKTTPCYSNSQS